MEMSRNANINCCYTADKEVQLLNVNCKVPTRNNELFNGFNQSLIEIRMNNKECIE